MRSTLVRFLPIAGLAVCIYFALRAEKPTEAAAGSHLRFVDVAAKAGIDVVNVSGDPRRWYIPESNGCGAAWLDHDQDGDIDLFVGNGAALEYVDDGRKLEVQRTATSRLYENQGRLRFDDVSVETGTARSDWINAVAVGDVEGDGDPDLYLGCFGPDVLLVKEGGRYVERTRELGLSNDSWAAGAAFGDPNRDGFLDLYVANYCVFDLENPPLEGRRNVIEGVEVGWGPEAENKRGYNRGAPDAYFLNDGKGDFREWTKEAGFQLEKALCSYACVWSDVDNDGWPDLLVANDMQPANLFRNQGDGRFRDEALERGFALDAEGKATSAMGLVVEDIDNDGDFDVLRTNFDFEPNSLHVNDGKGRFEDRAKAYGLAQPSLDKLGWGGAFLDADRDGDLELLVANGHVYPQAEQIGMHPWLQPTQLFDGVPHLRYGTVWQEATSEAGPGLAGRHSARGVAVADVDSDGDPDALVIDMDQRPRLLRNDGAKLGHWVGLQLEGRFSNRDAIGAKVQVTAGGKTWTREVRTTNGLYSSHDRRVLIGLGDATKIDRIAIRWPSGETQLEERALDHYHVIREHAAVARQR